LHNFLEKWEKGRKWPLPFTIFLFVFVVLFSLIVFENVAGFLVQSKSLGWREIPLSVSADSSDQSSGNYWLNFTMDDSSSQAVSKFGFHFYVSTNSSVSKNGVAQTPYSVEHLTNSGSSTLSYVTFNKVAPLFESYLYAINNSYAIVHHVSPQAPNNRYATLAQCSFTCISNGIFVGINTSGVGPPVYKAYSFWMNASDLILGFSDHTTVEIPNLAITINMTIQDLQSTWNFTPRVMISGHQYSVENQSNAATYTIDSDVSLQTPFETKSIMIIVIPPAALVVALSIVFIWRRRRAGIRLGRF